jgi:ketosteroid isomerase-like protein
VCAPAREGGSLVLQSVRLSRGARRGYSVVMSQENVDRLRATWDAWNRGDLDLSMLDPEVVFEETVLPESAGHTYHGHEGVLEAWTRWTEAWEEFTTEVEEIVDAGERLVAICTVRLQGRHSGAAMTVRYAYVYTLRDGKVIHMRSYLNPAEALESAGLRD